MRGDPVIVCPKCRVKRPVSRKAGRCRSCVNREKGVGIPSGEQTCSLRRAKILRVAFVLLASLRDARRDGCLKRAELNELDALLPALGNLTSYLVVTRHEHRGTRRRVPTVQPV